MMGTKGWERRDLEGRNCRQSPGPNHWPGFTTRYRL